MISDFRVIAESIVGKIDTIDRGEGYIQCPGKSFHSNRNGARDCRIYLRGVPSIYCMHTSCAAVIEEKNKALRSAIGKAERGANPNLAPWRPSQIDVVREREQKRVELHRKRAFAFFPTVLKNHACAPVDFWESSPYRLDGDAANDWRLLLQLYKPDDVLWIGSKYDSATDDKPDWQREQAASHFRPVSEWLKESKAPEQFTCPSIFKPGSSSRSNDNVVRKPYLVVESDTLSKDDCCALIRFIATRLWLRAIVDTAGKSLHAWFESPTTSNLADLKVILPAMQCDPALFKLSQPCRLPGADRSGKLQSLLYLDLEGVQ